MANERKTEAWVRKHFEKFKKHIDTEEQKSDFPKIDKLLKSASKTNSGAGYPEFIITFKNNSDLLIVVECKADTKKHASRQLNRYSEYAVDGALLYASYLSKEFDVLAIGASGETNREAKVSHYLHLKGKKTSTPIFGDKLLSVKNYLDGYLKSPEKFRQDYDKLLSFANKLNKNLHHKKIRENKRGLLISAILIALEEPAFKGSYALHSSPKNLAKSLVRTVSSQLESANLTQEKLDSLNVEFNFIKTDTSLSKGPQVLKEIIDEINENINGFVKTHQYVDVLGRLYVEFLRYTNSDKGLGIVLTPPHITEFCADLAQVNENSTIYDNCAGTGGFLISAMKKMITSAQDNEEVIKRIKSKQLIGTEYQADIFSLLISNMFVHQDGKTNVVKADCFDEDVVRKVKRQKPNVGFLNPPYKSEETDVEELEYVLNNLECLTTGGICIAIVPMHCALAQKGKTLELKKKILEKHTLEAVFSMPDELFAESANVVTCIMVFTAHSPHSSHKETYLAYYKDDGFKKIKNKGRIDAFDKWKDIKKEWVSTFINRKRKSGVSLKKKLVADMEWCVEEYMKTDYSILGYSSFETVVRDYVTFVLKNQVSK